MPRLTKRELVKELERLSTLKDYEQAHAKADQLILDYIGSKQIRTAYELITRHCA